MLDALGLDVDALEKRILDWANPTLGEPVSRNWPLARLEDALLVAGAYFIFVVVGSLIMWLIPSGGSAKGAKVDKASRSGGRAEEEGGSPFDGLVKALQPFYNFGQVVLCSYMTLRALEQAWREDYSIVCNPFDPKSDRVAFVLHVFYLSKVFDFVDTIFIVLRKKWRQLSFLHVYHHISIFLVYWLNSQAGYDGDIYLTVVLNSFVHTVMYLYYFLSPWITSIPGYKPWWKPLITYMQMLQFLCMNAQAIYLLLNGCAYPTNITALYLVYIISLFLLFSNFAMRNYCKKRPSTRSKKTQ